MRKLLFYSFIISLLWTFTACQKEITQKTNQQLLKRTTVQEGDSLYNSYYNYDDKNRLVSISSSDNQGQGEPYRISFFYNTQGRMVSATQAYNGTDSFHYDSQGRIIERLHATPTPTPYPGRSTFAYDIKGRLIADTTHSYWAKEIFEYATYTYDENDNIIESKVFRNNAGSFQQERSVRLQYDKNINPYYAFGHQLYCLKRSANGSEYLLSKNNCIKKTFDNGDVVTYQYLYEGDLPKSFAMTDSSDPGWILNLEFYY